MSNQKILSCLFCLFLLVVFTVNFTACGNNTAGGNTNALPPAPPPTATTAACSAGLVYTQFNCLATTNCSGAQAGWGYYPTTQQCYPPVAIPVGGVGVANFSQQGHWGGTLLAINQPVLQQLLQDSGQCNRYNIVNFGGERCDRYSSAGYVILYYNGGNSVFVQIGAGISNPVYTNLIPYAAGGAYNGGYGTGTLTTNISLQIVANGAGLQLTNTFQNSNVFSYPGQANTGGLTLTDANENFNSNTMQVTLAYNGQTLAIANLAHY